MRRRPGPTSHRRESTAWARSKTDRARTTGAVGPKRTHVSDLQTGPTCQCRDATGLRESWLGGPNLPGAAQSSSLIFYFLFSFIHPLSISKFESPNEF
jgi:hypothetical protein